MESTETIDKEAIDDFVREVIFLATKYKTVDEQFVAAKELLEKAPYDPNDLDNEEEYIDYKMQHHFLSNHVNCLKTDIQLDMKTEPADERGLVVVAAGKRNHKKLKLINAYIDTETHEIIKSAGNMRIAIAGLIEYAIQHLQETGQTLIVTGGKGE